MTESLRPVPACPICGKPRVKNLAPFCSKRCAHVDLGRWLNESYVIEGSDSPSAEDFDEE
ncbi:MAG: DNA gyrase inhibitor YacG [Alphaproteobacteria bacterium]